MKRMMAVAVLLFLAVAVFPGPVKAQAAPPTFFYVVTAVDSNGFESVFSNQISATFAQGKHIVNLTWTASTVPTGGATIASYNVYRGTVAGGPYTKVNAAPVTTVAYADSFTLPNAPSGLTATVN